MKLGPVTKLDKGNKAMLKKFDDDAMSANCDVTVRKSYSGRIVRETYIFINTNLLSYKN